MKFVKVQVFLDKYKELEKAIRDHFPQDSSVPTDMGSVGIYENSLKIKNSDDSEKMHYIRIMRNILVHNPGLDGFIAPTDLDVSFMNEHIKKLESIDGTVKDRYITIAKAGVLEPKTTIQKACLTFVSKKTDVLVVYDQKKNIMKYLTEHDIVKGISDGFKMTTTVDKLSLKEFEKPLENGVTIDTPLSKVSDIGKYPVPVLRSGKFVGILV